MSHKVITATSERLSCEGATETAQATRNHVQQAEDLKGKISTDRLKYVPEDGKDRKDNVKIYLQSYSVLPCFQRALC